MGSERISELRLYRKLFRTQLAEATLQTSLACLNHEAVLGKGRFREYIQNALACRSKFGCRGQPAKQTKPAGNFE